MNHVQPGLPQARASIIAEYTERGIVSPCQIKDFQAMYGLGHGQVEELVSDLIACEVWILDDGQAECLYAMQTSVFYQDKHRYNSLLNELPLYKFIAIFILLPSKEEMEISLFRALPNWRQYLRELSRLRLLSAGMDRDRVRLSDSFRRIQRAIHTYLDNGHVPDLQHSWRKLPKDSVMWAAAAVCRSPFFSDIVVPVVREYYLSLPEVAKLVSLIAGCKPQPPSMYGIVKHSICRGELREVWWILLGDAPSSALAAIENGRDICSRCLRVSGCTSYFAGYDQGAVQNLLRQYRGKIAAEYLQKLAEGGARIEELLPRLTEDVMLLKFVVSYNVVRSGKVFLGDINLLDKKILRKDIGRYCPFKDIWLLDKRPI